MFGLLTIFQWTSSNTEDMFSTTQTILSDFTPLLVPIIAVGVAIILIYAVAHIIKH